MRVACIVLAYHQPRQLALLVSLLRHPDARIYLHIDKRASMSPFRRALGAFTGDLVLLPRRRSAWGSAAVVDAALDGMQRGVRDGCGYFFLLSGQDLPLRPIGEIVAFAEEAGERSYMEHWPIGESVHRFNGRDRTDFYAYTVRGRREICIPRGEDTSFLDLKGRLLNHGLRLAARFRPPRSFPAYARPFAGATWWNLSLSAAEHVLAFLADHPDYRAYHEHTWVPEEVLIQSAIAGTGFASGHEVVNDALRYSRWDGVRAHTLDTSDVPALSSGDCLSPGSSIRMATPPSLSGWRSAYGHAEA